MKIKYELNGICLGHHYGDLGENVLMNIFNGRELLDLFVMETKSTIETKTKNVVNPE